MDVDLKLGLYILAVSGGVDSMVLLDVLAKKPGARLIVAHFNHGIRLDASSDEKLVVKAAKKYGLKIEIGSGRLGNGASEAQARQARYDFLEKIRQKHKAKVIITAHHQDDLIETAIINVLRGTGLKGLAAMQNNPKVLRPLVNTPKSELVAYAKRHKIQWREDHTNKNERYLRNYIRINITPKLNSQDRKKLLAYINKISAADQATSQIIATISQKIVKNGEISRRSFINLPSLVADSLLAYWLRQNGIRQFDKKTIQQLSNAIKTARPGTKHEISKGWHLRTSHSEAVIEPAKQ